MTLYDFIPVGAGQAISRTDLARITGLSDRELRLQIARERRAGHIILSDSSSGGYFRPESEAETVRFIRSMRNRARETLAVADATERSFMAETGQETLGGW